MDEHISDAMLNRLTLSGYTEGSVTDRWVDYLKTSTAWMSGDPEHINDLTGIWLEGLGAVGSTLNDKWFDYLGTAGFDLTGALPDRLLDFWQAEVPLP